MLLGTVDTGLETNMDKVIRIALACFLGTVVTALTAWYTQPSWYIGLITGAASGILTYHLPWALRWIKRIITHFHEYWEMALRTVRFVTCWIISPASSASIASYGVILTVTKTFFPSKLMLLLESPISGFLFLYGFLSFIFLMLATAGLNTLPDRENNFLHLHKGREQALIADSWLRIPIMYRAFFLMIGLMLRDALKQILPELRAIIRILQRNTAIWCATNAVLMGGVAFALCRIQNLQGTSVVVIAVLFGLIGTIIGVVGSMGRVRQQQRMSK